MDPYLLQHSIQLYQQAPAYFNPYQLDEMEKAAEEAGIAFKRNTTVEEKKLDDSITSQFTSGLFEGFFGPFAFGGWSDEPETESGALAHSIGSLIGFVPGILGGPLKLGGTALFKGAAIAGRAGAAQKIAKATNTGMTWLAKGPVAKSIPIRGAEAAEKWTIQKLANAGYDVQQYLDKGSKVAGIARSAQHLGVASVISSTWDGPDEWLNSYVHGMVAGGAFGTIGNFVNLGKALHHINPKIRKHTEDWIWNKVAKGMAGSMFQGGMSTFYGAPTATQVYEYLLGGYFGSQHPSEPVRIGRDYMAKYKKKNPLRSQDFDLLKSTDPNFKDLPEKAQDYVKDYYFKTIGDLHQGLKEGAAQKGPGGAIASMLRDALGEQREDIITKAELKFNKGREELTDREIFEIEADEIWKPMFELTENQLDVDTLTEAIMEGRTAELVGIEKEVYEVLPKELRDQIKTGDAEAVEVMVGIAQEIQKDRINEKTREDFISSEEIDADQNEVVSSNMRLKGFLIELQKIAIERDISELDVMNEAVHAYNETLQAKENYEAFVERFWKAYPTITPSPRQERFLKQLFRRLQTESLHPHYAWSKDKGELHPIVTYNKSGKLVRNSRPDKPEELHYRSTLLGKIGEIGERLKGYSISLVKGPKKRPVAPKKPVRQYTRKEDFVTSIGEKGKSKDKKTRGTWVELEQTGNSFTDSLEWWSYKDSKGKWRIVESRSGLALGAAKGKTKKEAIGLANKVIKENKDKIEKKLSKEIDSGNTIKGGKKAFEKLKKSLKEDTVSTKRAAVEVDRVNKVLEVNQDRLREKFNNKSWIEEGLPEETFNKYEDFEMWEIEKAIVEPKIFRTKKDKPGEFERRLAKYAYQSAKDKKFIFGENQQSREFKDIEIGYQVIKPYDNWYHWKKRAFEPAISPEDWRMITNDLDKKGYYLKIPRKDKGFEDIFPYHPNTSKTKLGSVLKDILEMYPDSKIKILFKYDQEQFLKTMQDLNADGERIPLKKGVKKKLIRWHEKAFISNFLYERKYTFKGTPDRVKRQTIFSDQEMPMNPVDYINIAPDGKFEMIFLLDEKAGGIKETFLTEKGRMLADSKTDGAMIFHSELFKTAVNAEGFEKSTSRLKPSGVSWADDGSVLIMKAGIHPSMGAFDVAIRPDQIIVYVSSAKSLPTGAKLYEGKVVNGEYRFKGVKKGDKPVGYKMPVEDLRLNYGVYEDFTSGKPQRIKKQFHTFLNSLQVSKAGFDAFVGATIDKAIAGDERANLIAREWIQDPTKIPGRKEFEIKDISYELVTEILNKHINHPIYKELISDMMNETRFTNTEEEMGKESEIQELKEYTTRLTEWLKNTDFHPIVPQLMENNLFQAMVLKYTHDKATYPEWKWSGVGSVGAVHGVIESIYGEIKADTFKLGHSHKKTMVKWTDTGTEMTLEDAWKAYDAIKNRKQFKGKTAKIKQMEEDLRFALMRIPSPGVSGTRMLRFDGWIENDRDMTDYGVYTRSRDHFYFDGADVDMDKLYFYQGLPQEFKDEIWKNRHELEHKNKKGEWVMNKSKDPALNKEHGSELNKFETLIADKNKADPAAQWLPWGLRQAGMAGYRGKNGMGVVINAKGFLNTVVADVLKNHDGVLDIELQKDGKVWGHLKGKTTKKQIEKVFRKYLVEASQRTADAANYFRINTPVQMAEMLVKKAFPDLKMSVWDKKTKKFVEKPFEYKVFKASHYADLLEVNNLLYGKNYRQNRMHTLSEVQDGLREMTATGDYMSSVWHIGKALSQHEIIADPMRFWPDKKAHKIWRESFQLFNEAFANDKTLKRFLVRGGGVKVIARYVIMKSEEGEALSIAEKRLNQHYDEKEAKGWKGKRRRAIKWVDIGMKGLFKVPITKKDKVRLDKTEQELFNKLWHNGDISRPDPKLEVIMKLNDAMDVWSSVNIASNSQPLLNALKKAGHKDRFNEIVKDLSVFSDAIKQDYIMSRGLDRKKNVPVYKTVDQIEQQIIAKKNAIKEQAESLGIEPELMLEYFYSRMLGSVWARGLNKDKVRSELAKHIKELSQTPAENMEELQHYKEKLENFKKYYNKTSFHRFPIETSTIPNAAKKQFMKGFSEMFDLLRTGFENVAEVTELAKERDRISQVIKDREAIRLKADIASEMDRTREVREELIEFTDEPLDNIWNIEQQKLKKKDIPDDIPRVIEKIAEHFKGLPSAALYRINDIFAFMTQERDGVAMSVEQMRWQDVRDLERFMGDIHRYGTKDKSPNSLYYFLFPERAAQKMLTHDYTQVWKTPMPYIDSTGGKSIRSVDVPVGTMQLLNNTFGHIYTMENALKQEWLAFRDDHYKIKNKILSMENGIDEWEKVHRVAVATMLRDRTGGSAKKFYEELYKENEKEYDEILKTEYQIAEEGGETRVWKGKDVIDEVIDKHKTFYDIIYKKFVKSGIDWDLIDNKGIYGSITADGQRTMLHYDKYGRLMIDSALQRILKPIVSGNLGAMGNIGKEGLSVELLNRVQYEWALERIIENDPSLRKPNGKINNDKAHRFRRRFRMDDNSKFNPIGFQREYWPQMMHLATTEGKEKVRVWMEGQAMTLRDYLENALSIRTATGDRNMIEERAKGIDKRFRITEEEWRQLDEGKISEESLISDKMAQQERAFETLVGRRVSADGGAGESAAQWMSATFNNRNDLVASGFFSRPGSGRARGPDPMPGFSMDFDVTSKYTDQWISAFYRNITSLIAKKKIDEYVKRNSLGDDSATQQWANLMRMYSRDVMGYPSLFSKDMMSLTPDERKAHEKTVHTIKHLRGRRSKANTLKLLNAQNALQVDSYKPKFEGAAGWVYYHLTDQYWVSKLDKMSTKFYDGSIPFYGELPKDPIARHKALTRVLHNMGSFEAKWTLISLLAHPKTLIGNMLGGSHNTISRVGMRHWLNSRDLAYLKNNVFQGATLRDGTKIDSWETVQRFVEESGAMESFIVTEAQLERAFTGKRAGSFLNEMLRKLRSDPTLTDATTYEIAAKHGLARNFVDKAAWFMRYSERMLRRDAFLSHYLNAKEILSKIVPEHKFDNQFLLQFAQEGVKATQFLYHSAFRPAFSRTTIGKVMTRFHPFAWNSVRLRRETYAKARRYGWDEGSIPFKRLERLMVQDAMVFALAQIFISSLFDSSMPPPMSWMQDTADWLFGDPKDREKAFFNQWPHPVLAPLSVATPPIARIPLNTINAMVNGNWERFADYQVFTWFPFGRLIRSGLKTIETPEMILEQMTGFPIHGIGRKFRAAREDGAEA